MEFINKIILESSCRSVFQIYSSISRIIRVSTFIFLIWFIYFVYIYFWRMFSLHCYLFSISFYRHLLYKKNKETKVKYFKSGWLSWQAQYFQHEELGTQQYYYKI